MFSNDSNYLNYPITVIFFTILTYKFISLYFLLKFVIQFYLLVLMQIEKCRIFPGKFVFFRNLLFLPLIVWRSITLNWKITKVQMICENLQWNKWRSFCPYTGWILEGVLKRRSYKRKSVGCGKTIRNIEVRVYRINT